MNPALLRQPFVLATCLFALTSTTAGFAVEPSGSDGEKPAADVECALEAIKRIQAGDINAALELLAKPRGKNPSLQPRSPIKPFGQTALPRALLEIVVIGWPDDPEAYVFLADLNLREGCYTEADLLLAKAAALLPSLKDNRKRQDTLRQYILAGQAIVAEYRENWSGARKLLEECLALDPKNVNALQQLGRVLFRQNKKSTRKEAYARFKEAKAIDPKVLLPEAQMAQLYEAAQRHAAARKWIERALKAAPKDDVETRLVAARWALETDQLDKAKKWSDDALAIDPKNVNALNMCGIMALFREDYKAAERFFETAHLIAPDNFAASNNLALALAEQGDSKKQQKALEYAADNGRRFPRSVEAASTYGWAFYKRGRFDGSEAERTFAEALTSAGVDGREKSWTGTALKEAMKKAQEKGPVLTLSGGTVSLVEQPVVWLRSLSPDTLYYYARVVIDNGRVEFGTQLLMTALQTKAPFVNRKKAEAALKELREKTTIPDPTM